MRLSAVVLIFCPPVGGGRGGRTVVYLIQLCGLTPFVAGDDFSFCKSPQLVIQVSPDDPSEVMCGCCSSCLNYKRRLRSRRFAVYMQNKKWRRYAS